MALFENIADVLRGRFVPVDDLTQKKKSERPFTLYSAVMENFGIGSTDTLFSARNHAELRRAVRWTYSILDEVTGTRSEPWAMQLERTESEILDALSEAGRQHPATEFDDLRGDLRVGLGKVAGRGKMRGALACEATRVAFISGSDFAEVISRLADDGVRDEEILAELEAIPGTIEQKEADWTVAANWALRFNDYASADPANTSLSAYCRWLSEDWSDMTDERLMARLENVAG